MNPALPKGAGTKRRKGGVKIGVIADTHIPDRAEDIPQVILEAFMHMDMVIHVGDLADLSVWDKLKAVCKNVKIVCGNMDNEEIKKKFPEKEVIKAGNYKIGIMHGYGAPHNLINVLNEAFKNDHPDIIIFGHSHAGFNEKRGGILYFNPGSPTDTIFAPYNSYGIIEINSEIKAEIIKI